MAEVVVGVDDEARARDYVDALAEAGHDARPVPALETTSPRRFSRVPDILVIDGDAKGMKVEVVVAAWQKVRPRPALVIMGSRAPVRVAAEKSGTLFLPGPIKAAELVVAIQRATRTAGIVPAPSAESALLALGLVPGGEAEDEAATICAGARKMDPGFVKNTLKPYAGDYVARTELVDRLCARRALSPDEARIAVSLDGSRTLRSIIDNSGYDAVFVARVLWGLACGQAVEFSREPPAEASTRARRVAEARDHLRARAARLRDRPTPYDILEMPPGSPTGEIDRAYKSLGLRFAPRRVEGFDLGSVGRVVEPLWRQIEQAASLLMDPARREEYEVELARFRPQILEKWRQWKENRQKAEEAFVAGQKALAAGDAFRAVSQIAQAARQLPGEPDYEVYVSWTRVVAEAARNKDNDDVRRETARRERRTAESALWGRRPRARALFALGLLCETAGDDDAAGRHFTEALALRPDLTAARTALERLRSG